MIQTKNISKYFGSFAALANVTFAVGQGEVVGLLGRNGAGKTTLMRILTGYYSPSAGEVLIDGINVSQDPQGASRQVGYLPENPPLYPEMKVSDYLKFAARIKDVPKKEILHRLEYCYQNCNIADVKEQVIGTLSQGYRQRVGIAQAIIHDPKVLILDEPTNGLDPIQVQGVRQLIQNLKEDRTVIISTHILSELEILAKRIVILREGAIVHDSSLEDVFKQERSLELFFLGLHDHE